jgi:hypothetical protein
MASFSLSAAAPRKFNSASLPHRGTVSSGPVLRRFLPAYQPAKSSALIRARVQGQQFFIAASSPTRWSRRTVYERFSTGTELGLPIVAKHRILRSSSAMRNGPRDAPHRYRRCCCTIADRQLSVHEAKNGDRCNEHRQHPQATLDASYPHRRSTPSVFSLCVAYSLRMGQYAVRAAR